MKRQYEITSVYVSNNNDEQDIWSLNSEKNGLSRDAE